MPHDQWRACCAGILWAPSAGSTANRCVSVSGSSRSRSASMNDGYLQPNAHRISDLGAGPVTGRFKLNVRSSAQSPQARQPLHAAQPWCGDGAAAAPEPSEACSLLRRSRSTSHCAVACQAGRSPLLDEAVQSVRRQPRHELPRKVRIALRLRLADLLLVRMLLPAPPVQRLQFAACSQSHARGRWTMPVKA